MFHAIMQREKYYNNADYLQVDEKAQETSVWTNQKKSKKKKKNSNGKILLSL